MILYIVQPMNSTRTIGISKQQKCTRHKAHSRFDNNEVSFSVLFVLSCNRQKPNSHAQYALFVRLQIECLFFHFVLQYRIYSFHDYSLLSSMYNRTQTIRIHLCAFFEMLLHFIIHRKCKCIHTIWNSFFLEIFIDWIILTFFFVFELIWFMFVFRNWIFNPQSVLWTQKKTFFLNPKCKVPNGCYQ